MNEADVAVAALAAVAVVVLAEHLCIWSLFWKRGWRVIVPVQKTAGSENKNAVAGAGPAGNAPPATVPFEKDRSAA